MYLQNRVSPVIKNWKDCRFSVGANAPNFAYSQEIIDLGFKHIYACDNPEILQARGLPHVPIIYNSDAEKNVALLHQTDPLSGISEEAFRCVLPGIERSLAPCQFCKHHMDRQKEKSSSQ